MSGVHTYALDWCRGALLCGAVFFGVSANAAIVLPQSTDNAEKAPAPPPVTGAPAGAGSIRMPAQPQSEASLQALRSQAQAGDVYAQMELGLYYYRNAGMQQAGAQARQWWTAAAGQGDARAMAGLGYMLGMGSGGVRDVPAGRQWLQRAASTGLPKASYLLSLVERRVTGPKAMQQSRVLLEQAAKDGDAMALNDLAVERELDGRATEAKDLYAQAAAKGNTTAQQNLGRLANYQRAGDVEQIARLRALADDGNADALLELAYRYHLGRGVQRNFATAIQYYRRAADAGSPKAREFLGLIFSRSNGKQAVIDEAWMQELAARINAVALKVESKTPAQLPDRPVRVSDPLADLLRQPFTAPAASSVPGAAVAANRSPAGAASDAPTDSAYGVREHLRKPQANFYEDAGNAPP